MLKTTVEAQPDTCEAHRVADPQQNQCLLSLANRKAHRFLRWAQRSATRRSNSMLDRFGYSSPVDSPEDPMCAIIRRSIPTTTATTPMGAT